MICFFRGHSPASHRRPRLDHMSINYQGLRKKAA
jgi:hypothetical protein